jgi:hypothetical protein
MAVFYCRVRNVTSGQSRDIVVGQSEEEVVEKTINHEPVPKIVGIV